MLLKTRPAQPTAEAPAPLEAWEGAGGDGAQPGLVQQALAGGRRHLPRHLLQAWGWERRERAGTSISPLSLPRRAELYFWKQFNGLLITLIGFVSG